MYQLGSNASDTSEKDVRQPLLPPYGPTRTPSCSSSHQSSVWKRRHETYRWAWIVVSTLLIIFTGTIIFLDPGHSTDFSLSPEGLEYSAWKHLRNHVSLLDVPSITREEFLARQKTLATKLDEAGVDAFIAEPSASTAYFANVSSAFELSERPFLVIIDKSGQFAYLAPKFELGRIAGLTMVFEEKKVIEWAEETSPYEALKKATGFEKIMLDEHARFMIASGLQNAGIEVVPTSLEIQQLRAVKSEAEIAILKGINQFTLQLIRSLQKSIRVGMTQATVVTAAEHLFARAGIGAGFWSIVLFGEQAASPHGGSSGKTLTDGEFVLIDIGSALHSYGSDVTRTILPSKSKVSDELMDMWNLVHSAQAAAIEHMLVNETCSVVDAASRKPITEAGLGEFFTHRLGHGLGLEMHEHPYLNGANSEKLKIGEVVTNEPGIYVTDDDAKKIGNRIGGFGVRLEDPILVAADGGVPMTGGTARSPYEP